MQVQKIKLAHNDSEICATYACPLGFPAYLVRARQPNLALVLLECLFCYNRFHFTDAGFSYRVGRYSSEKCKLTYEKSISEMTYFC